MLLTLLAVRTSGRSLPAGAEVLKGLKAGVRQAVEQGWLAEKKESVPAVSKSGKASVKKVAVLELTDQGEQALFAAAGADALAATASAHVDGLRAGLDADRRALREEILATLSTKPPKGSDVTKELAGLVKALADLGKRLEKLEAALAGGGAGPILDRIDRAFAALEAKLDRALPGRRAATASPGTSSPPTSAPAEPPRLAAVLRQAYDKLTQFVEFEDGLVEIPRLYHEARRARPDLSVEACHRELEALWGRRELELKVLNEVRLASEPDKGIRRDDNLYYFVYWPRRTTRP